MMPKQKGINFNWKHQTVAKKQEKQARLIVTPEIHTKKDNFGIEIKNMVKTDKFYAWKFNMLQNKKQNDLLIPRAGRLFVQ